METKRKVTVSWSGGKDSAIALYDLSKDPGVEIVNLHTVINLETKRVGMHGVREELVERQALALGLPLRKIYTPAASTHTEYENAMKLFFESAKREGIDTVVYGDIFLRDLRSYREKLLAESGLSSMYPIWEVETELLLQRLLNLGFKTVLCVVNQACYDQNLLGRTIDQEFRASLPEATDPCGERGEFHTFLYSGPIFSHAIKWKAGDQVSKSYEFQVTDANGNIQLQEKVFWFQDILLD